MQSQRALAILPKRAFATIGITLNLPEWGQNP
jgi:hypothetical protein